MQKLTMAEDTSDLSTDSDPNVSKLKRRRHARKILSDVEEGSENDSEACTKVHLPPFPMPP